MALLAAISTAAAAQGRVVLYTSVPLELATRFSEEFMKVNRNIKVEIFRAGSTDVINKIWAENEAGGVKADVIWLADAAAYYTMKDRGLLLQYVSPESANVPAEIKDPDGYFTGARIINMIIGINTNLVRDRSTARTWNQVLSFGKRAAMADPLYSGSNFMVTATFVKTHGDWTWFETARKNNVQVLRGNSDVARGLAAGEFAVAMVLDYMVYELKQQGAPVDIIWPDDGAISIPSPVAITAATKDAASSKAFVDFVLSKKGQELMVRDGVLPVRGDVVPPAGMPTPDKIKFMPIPFVWAAENTTMLRETYERIMTR
jgi:iron(III) transport system substrate-binding protein